MSNPTEPLGYYAGYLAGRRDALAERPQVVTESASVKVAREVLAASKAAPSDHSEAAGWWGQLEAALEMLLHYVDEREGRA